MANKSKRKAAAAATAAAAADGGRAGVAAADGSSEPSTSGRPYTVSMAVSSSSIDNTQNIEFATFVAGQVRSCHKLQTMAWLTTTHQQPPHIGPVFFLPSAVPTDRAHGSYLQHRRAGHYRRHAAAQGRHCQRRGSLPGTSGAVPGDATVPAQGTHTHAPRPAPGR